MSAHCFQMARRIAGARGNAPAIVQGDLTLSFADLMDGGLRWAARLAIEPGERVILSAPNGPDFAAAVLGIWARGGIPTLVHADAPASHLAHAVAVTQARLLLGAVEIDACETIALRTPEVPASVVRDSAGQTQDDPASILFTSGSTGLPKGVAQSAHTLVDSVGRIGRHMGYRADDRLVCPVPFAFDYGWGQLLSVLLGGTTLVLPAAPGGLALCEAIERHRPTVLAGVPALFADLFAGVAPVHATDLSSIRLVTSTGSRIPDAVFQAMLGAFPDADISLNYGLTETYRSASLPAALARSHSGSVGLGIEGVDLAVLREDGCVAAPGEEGEVVHRGAGVFLGYWGDPVRTAEVRRPDPLWPHRGIEPPYAVFTGDLGWKDSDGLLHLVGRRDRQLKSMGVRVSPDEVEALILSSGLVAEAAVVARPHHTLGQMIVAVVAPEDPAALKPLKLHARQTMSPWMQPRDWRLVPRLPRLPGGKVDYAGLAQLVAG